MVNKSGVITLLFLVLGGAIVGGWFYYKSLPQEPEDYALAVMDALQAKDIRLARRLADEGVARYPDNNGLWHVAANVAQMQDKKEAALRYLSHVTDDGENTILPFSQKAQLLIRTGRPNEAEKVIATILKYDPGNLIANQMLFTIYRLGGRSFEARQPIEKIIRSKGFDTKLCFMRLVPDVAWISEKEDKELLDAAAAEGQSTPLTGSGLNQLTNGRLDEATRSYQAATSVDPNSMEAQARLGWCFIKAEDQQQFAAWKKQLTKKTFRHPITWLCLGAEAEASGKNDVAIRCFAEALKRDPDNRLACNSLVRTLKVAGRNEDAKRFESDAQALTDLHETMRPNRTIDPSEEDGRIQVIRALIKLRRYLELEVWLESSKAEAVKNEAPAEAVFQQIEEIIEPYLTQLPPDGHFSDPAQHPMTGFDLSQFPLPDGIDPDSAPDKLDPPPKTDVDPHAGHNHG